jgi:hypothetical protein
MPIAVEAVSIEKYLLWLSNNLFVIAFVIKNRN